MIPWVGGKGKLMWLINLLAPTGYDRFIDAFGGSAAVTMNRPIQKGCLEVYNDYNSNLTNLFYCVRERTMALLKELGFLPLNSRDEFAVLEKFFEQEEFTEDYLEEELWLTQLYFPPPQAKRIRRLMKKRSRLGDVRRAADYYKLIRYSFSGGGKVFGGRSCDIRRFFYQIWECSRRLAEVVIENKDFEDVSDQYDRETALLYYDPPYYQAEGFYAVVFTREDHLRLHNVALTRKGFVMISYNYCDFIMDLYPEFYIFRTTRPNSLSQKADSEYQEIVITNYDPRKFPRQCSMFALPDGGSGAQYELIHEPPKAIKEPFEEERHEK